MNVLLMLIKLLLFFGEDVVKERGVKHGAKSAGIKGMFKNCAVDNRNYV